MNGSTGLEVYNTYTMSMRISFSFFLIFRIILSSPIVVLAHSQTPIKPNTEIRSKPPYTAFKLLEDTA